MIRVLKEDILSEWPEVRKGLLAILAKTGESWIPEDVYHELKIGKCALHKKGGAFVIVRPDGDALDVWCAYNDGDGFEDKFKWLKSHAKQHNFNRLTMTSPRKGWEKYFTAVSINYEVKL